MRKTILLLLAPIFFFISCRKDKSTFDGPSIAEIFSDFKVLENFKANKDSVNFNSGELVTFSAAFNKVVSWTITVTGSTSKASKIIKGEGRTISVVNGQWNGSTSLFPLFAIENCTAKLKIKDVLDSFSVNIKIIQPKKIDGFLIADFESGLNTKWTKFVQSGANMDFQVKTDSFAPEGKKYLNMAGTVNWDYLIGLIDFPATAYGANVTFPLSSNADAEYFNCLIYGVPNTNPSIVLFQFKEDENGDGTFNANNEDEYDYEIKVDWDGWKLVSVRYTDIVTLVNGVPAVAKGNALHNPNKLGKISMLHLANPANGFASCKLDLVMFTTNKPLEP
ncbi:MAG: hypothetical protein NTW54_07545 [Bacteroidetes bacterium]|nr:hypothetical protein [Bacteroidota bacterium]